ncbi:LGFP repeat-containing protein [Rhodococcus jostii]|uniref:LGFP repeat-containing protein n=1 Tax=Rhodococcus jostii TaxID=132919 RepID=UPI00363C6797
MYEKYYVCGLILEKYRAMDGPRGSLGMPTSNEKVLPDQVGRVSVFEHGSIYWSPSSDAHPIWGRIGDKWGQKGWEGGFLHYPTSDELRNPDGHGLHQTFQGGSIYYSPETDAHSIGGLIRDKWAEKGWERGPLGYPKTDETGASGGAFNHFQGGSVYWSPATGAHSIWGAIRDSWAEQGWERSPYGFPTTDEQDSTQFESSFQQGFQSGSIDAAFLFVPLWDPTSDSEPSAPGDGFCILGTYGGPGGACRLAGSWKDGTCIATLAVFTGSVLLPAAKLLKIRDFMKAVRGAKGAVDLWKGEKATKLREQIWANSGKISLAIAADFLELTALEAACR